MRLEGIVCPHCNSGHVGIHSRVERRYQCHSCGKTFSETSGTPLWIVTLVLALLSHGCPLQAIVFAFGIDERTVKAWQTKAGQHARRVQEHLVCSGRRDLGQVQADEMYVRAQGGRLWMATAMSVFARLFVWGAVAVQRDEHLLARVIGMVRRAARLGQAILRWLQVVCSHHYSGHFAITRTPPAGGAQGRAHRPGH
jgi:transposase-like protein